MNKEFVPYELALKLKQLGFDEPCAMYYQDERFDDAIGSQNSDKAEWVTCTAPLFQQSFRWFREKNQLDTSINTVYSKYNDTLSKKYSGVIDDKSVFTNIGFYDTYEEAELACLERLIAIVETKQQEQ
jgi:hypothetical protein